MLFPFSCFIDAQTSYLLLENIDPGKNQFRIYLIQAKEEEGSFIVYLSRGRIAHPLRCKQEFFAEKSQFLSFLKSNIVKRRRHGYRLVEMSLDFPLFLILHEMNLDFRSKGHHDLS